MIAIRASALGCFLFVLSACNNGIRPTGPTPVAQPAAVTVQPPPSAVFPPVPSNARAYVFTAPSSYPVGHYTVGSRYVLGSDGTFSLQYTSLGKEYVGTFTENRGSVALRFAADGRWDAAGTIDGDLLVVRYNLVMELSDFEDAVYKHSR